MTVKRSASLDAIVIGAGINGLSAAITLARAGRSVRVYEGQSTIGGSARSFPLTLPGFTHDWGAAVHSLALASPFFRTVPLAKLGVEFAHPSAPFAHPLDDGTAAVVEQSVAETVEHFNKHDADVWRKLVTPFVNHADELFDALLGPLSFKHPLLMAHFGLHAVQPAQQFAMRHFQGEQARALFAGAAAHSLLPLTALATTGYALGLIVAAHAYGWPVVRGGTQNVTNAMAAYFTSLGGEIVVDSPVSSLHDLPDSRAVLCDVTPAQLLKICANEMPTVYGARLRNYEYGSGVFKMDWALNAPVPWKSAGCRRASTIHVGGTLAEIAAGEQTVIDGGYPEKPFLIAVQPSLCDPARAPEGHHTLWAYCHVPRGSTVDMRARIERQIERFAPGFRDCIIAASALDTKGLERGNANIVGGDIAGGAGTLLQLYARPVLSFDPYKTEMDGVYLCSSSTPPGVGVHGMCGYHAAQSALRKSLGGV
ncbi:MAG: NAD(P)/FAD-dependent oxidoreductase [Gemmatimonadota bacterium]|nr:NAD(P)/FAD-dependent oxidoreductase [Gemmatimonadota bacterium]